MIDRILEAGATFDFFSPLASIVGDVMHGGGHTFLIPISASPLTGREIERMLRKRGIGTWGAMIVDGTLTISVRKADARKASAILQRANVPVENPVETNAPKRKRASKGSPFAVFDIFRR